MKTITLGEAKREAQRLVRLVDQLGTAMYQDKHTGDPNYEYQRQTAAIRRASMDLTRTLADLRQNRLPGERA